MLSVAILAYEKWTKNQVQQHGQGRSRRLRDADQFITDVKVDLLHVEQEARNEAGLTHVTAANNVSRGQPQTRGIQRGFPLSSNLLQCASIQ
jgi:hypothetical protein